MRSTGAALFQDDTLVPNRHTRLPVPRVQVQVEAGEDLRAALGMARAAEERERVLFDNARDAIALLDRDGTIVEANRRWGEMMEVAPAALVGRSVREFAAPGHEDDNLRAFRAMTAAGGGLTQRVAVARPDDGVYLMEFSDAPVTLCGRELVLSIGRDITQQVESARSLEAAERQYRSLVERMPDVVWTADAKGRFTFVTPNVERLLGVTVEHAMAVGTAGWFERLHPDDFARVKDAYAGLLAGRGPIDIEYRMRHEDGRWIWVRDRTTAAYEHDGVRCIDGMASDVTQQRRLQDSVHQAQKMDAIGQLTGGIAHDFNNMLAAILANTHFLLEQLPEHVPYRADVGEIQQAAERAATLTRQLLAFGRRQVMAPRVVQADDVVTGLEPMLRRLIGEDIAVRVEAAAAAAGAIRVDLGQLEQVVMNLTVNARDAMPDGGTLTIATATVDLAERMAGDAGSVPAGRWVRLSAQDTGTGIDHAIRRRLFEPFFTTKAVGRGTGLGLSTCYGIVEQSGGHIVVHTEVGRGSTFEVYLPRVVAPAVPAAAPPVRAVRYRGTETILLVEDEPTVRAAVRRLLAPCGYKLLLASGGEEALAIVAAHDGPIDLVLSDVVMPGASGPEVVERIRAARPGVRAVFMSGYTDHPRLRDGGHELELLQKPFTSEALARKLRDVLDAPAEAGGAG